MAWDLILLDTDIGEAGLWIRQGVTAWSLVVCYRTLILAKFVFGVIAAFQAVICLVLLINQVTNWKSMADLIFSILHPSKLLHYPRSSNISRSQRIASHILLFYVFLLGILWRQNEWGSGGYQCDSKPKVGVRWLSLFDSANMICSVLPMAGIYSFRVSIRLSIASMSRRRDIQAWDMGYLL